MLLKRTLVLMLIIANYNLFGADYLVTTQNEKLRAAYKLIADSYYERGRTLVVSFPDNFVPDNNSSLESISFEQISTEFVASTNITKNEEIADYLNNVSMANLNSTIVKLASLSNLSMGSSGNLAATTWLSDQFRLLGYQSSLDCFQGNSCNVVAGSIIPEKKNILIIAHFDTVGKMNAGADDNSSGVAGLLELARLSASVNSSVNFVFVAANGEEKGLIGSTAFVNRFKSSLKHISFVINMDMIGYNKSNILDLETNVEFKEQVQVVAEMAKTYTDLMPRVISPAWGSDHVPFLKNKIPAVLTIEDWDNHNPCYHQSCDTIDKVDFTYMRKVVQTNLAYMLHQ